MTREIKFRAWHLDEKKMWIEVGTDGEGSTIIDAKHMGLQYLKGKTILMQYAGFKDKNGVEGYHKDIAEGYSKWLIEWDDNEGGFYLKSMAGYDKLPLRKLKEMRIVGNEYENPELLKESPDDKT